MLRLAEEKKDGNATDPVTTITKRAARRGGRLRLRLRQTERQTECGHKWQWVHPFVKMCVRMTVIES